MGEATARTDNLEKLVEAGNELKVFGLMEEEPLKTQNSVSNKKRFESSVNMNTDREGSEQNENNTSDINVADLFKIEHEAEVLKCGLEEVDEYKDEPDSARLLTEIKKRILSNVDDLGNKNFKCNVCEREFATLKYIKNHIETHLEGFSHKCKFCDVVKRTRKSIYYHQKTCHKSINNETINTKKHEDDINEVDKTSTEAEVDMDPLSNTETEIEAVCEEDKTADGKEAKQVVKGEIVDDSNKERFEKELESLIITGEGNNHYECKVCQKELKVKTKMKLHAEVHLEGFSHKCKYCETVKKTLRSIQQHEWDQHRRNGIDTKN